MRRLPPAFRLTCVWSLRPFVDLAEGAEGLFNAEDRDTKKIARHGGGLRTRTALFWYCRPESTSPSRLRRRSVVPFWAYELFAIAHGGHLFALLAPTVGVGAPAACRPPHPSGIMNHDCTVL